MYKTQYEVSESIVASFTDGPGNPTDWIGIYTNPGNAPSGCSSNGASTIWLYVNGKQNAGVGISDGSVTFSDSSIGSDSNWPLAEGDYVAYFLENDGYCQLGNSVEFSVAAPIYRPGLASSPSPGNGAVDVDMDADLSFVPGEYSASHDIYFGTSAYLDSEDFAGNQAGTTFDPGILREDTLYYWRVDEVNTADTTRGDVWSFTTQGPIVGDGYNVSKNDDFSTDDSVFSLSDTMYIQIWSDRVDHTNMKKAERELKIGGQRFKANLANNGDGTFAGSIDLSQLPTGTGTLKLKLEDKNRNKYEVKDLPITVSD